LSEEDESKIGNAKLYTVLVYPAKDKLSATLQSIYRITPDLAHMNEHVYAQSFASCHFINFNDRLNGVCS